MKKLVKDFLSGDSRSWTIKHYLIYSSITIIIGLSHGALVGIIKNIFL